MPNHQIKNMINKKPKIFTVTRTPKDIDNILSVKPDVAASYYCAVVNVSDSPCASFDYQLKVPSFWFPINEISQWSHSPFFGTLKVVNHYFKGDKSVLIHCHAGANRSPSIAYAILLAKGYTPQEAEESLNYEKLSEVFQRNIERKHIPKNIIEFLKMADEDTTTSLHMVLRNIDALYDEWSQKKFDEQNDYMLKSDDESSARLIYNKEKKRFVIVKEELSDKPIFPPNQLLTEGELRMKTTPWVDPIFERKEWYITPTVPELKK